MNKQDLQGARTPSMLEQKYSFGKTFAEVMGVATKAKESADDASKKVSELDTKLDQTEIFNRLTNNGETQGIFREDGQLYINASYIRSIAELFAHDIIMTGTFSTTAETFIEPGEEEVEHTRQIILGNEPYSVLYDFNNDGVVDVIDLLMARKANLGIQSLSGWSGAVVSTVEITINPSNPNKCIQVTGTNMWGRAVDSYIGVNATSIKNPSTERRISTLISDLTDMANGIKYATSISELNAAADTFYNKYK